MRFAIENAEGEKAQRAYARLAGFLLLGVIVIAIGSGVVLSRVGGSGTFAETAKRVAASEHVYRAALSAAVIVSLGSANLLISPPVLASTLRMVLLSLSRANRFWPSPVSCKRAA